MKPKTGIYLIPDERYFYCLRIERTYNVMTDFLGNQTPLPEGVWRIEATRFDITDNREPTGDHSNPNFVFDIKSIGPGQWVEVFQFFENEEPRMFEEYGQLSLF